MAEIQKESLQELTEEKEKQEEVCETRTSPGSAFEGIYDHLPDISIRALDWFIAACIVALIAVVLIGVLKARHMI